MLIVPSVVAVPVLHAFTVIVLLGGEQLIADPILAAVLTGEPSGSIGIFVKYLDKSDVKSTHPVVCVEQPPVTIDVEHAPVPNCQSTPCALAAKDGGKLLLSIIY